ncbi:B12-binding domain-containing radical SAM protein [Coralliovum pocilloporae]|uniref:B12-binding domain-containing radical SAM protein n=1 Tax=Coralliovum pocilloporae TaxID=3066369 RepID=UPI003307646C
MAKPPKVLLVYPKSSEDSFWCYTRSCRLVGAKYPSPPLGLITVAAMLPEDWSVRLIDCNISPLHDKDICAADMVMTGGMMPQQETCLALIKRCKKLGVPVVVGGPDATSSPQVYKDADFRVLGEVEHSIQDFIAAWNRGERTGDFEDEKFKADVTTTPLPRYDLLRFSNYAKISVQFSRGCPFTCEFCDIIELYGRRPRTKTTTQVLAELDQLYRMGFRGHLDFVDDNLIGNKKAIKAFMPHLIQWQKDHGYPFLLSTEASLNLSDDPELLEMMRDANFFIIFIGIESPDPEILNATQKKQNTRRDITESLMAIYDAGIVAVAGFIVGFDEERHSVEDPIVDLIEDASIPVAMPGLLYALPNTQLTRRLETEGRLFDAFEIHSSEHGSDQCVAGLNFETLRPREDIIQDYANIVRRIYTPEAYFSRLRALIKRLNLSGENGKVIRRSCFKNDAKQFVRLMKRFNRDYPDYRKEFWKTLGYLLFTKPKALKACLYLTAFYAHLGGYSTYVVERMDAQLAQLASGATPETARQVHSAAE